MTSNSRGILVLGASLLMIAALGMSTMSGTGWVIPMATLLSGIFLILVFSFITFTEEKQRGSTPVGNSKGNVSENIESDAEDLPDPNDAGFELPIL
ncbi:MAG: hypothetical protein CMA90_00645 [Euryarchaeota archaeon]|nr:hypothetical protein [Euryarchaeota archaeon]